MNLPNREFFRKKNIPFFFLNSLPVQSRCQEPTRGRTSLSSSWPPGMSYGSSALLCTCRWAPRCQASPGLLEVFSSCSSPGHPRDFKEDQRIIDSCLNSQLTRNNQGPRDISLCPEQGSIDFCQILPVPRWGSHRTRTIHHRKLKRLL